MENKAHKIDKIFKHSLDNQSITPSTDAWMAVRAYTIGQEESKKKVWLRYTSLGLLVLLFLGLGYGISLNLDCEKSHRVDLRISILKTQSKIQESINPVDSKSDGTDSKISSIILGKKNHKSFNLHGSMFRNPNSNNFLHNNSVEKIHKSINRHGATFRNPSSDINELLVENTNNGENDNEITAIESKPLIANDLSDKMQKESEKKIVDLEGSLVDKEDSVVYGEKFSLKHPIITLGVFGHSWNNWKVTSDNSLYGKLLYPSISEGNNMQLGIAWKVNKKLRLGISIGTNNYNIGIPFVSMPVLSSAFGVPSVKLTQINSDQFYQLETPFGNVNLPVSKFKEFPTNIPNVLDSNRAVLHQNSQIMKVICFSINSKYDILSKKREKGRKYGYQIYGLGDFIIQRQTGYSYNTIDRKAYLKAISTSPNIYGENETINQELNHLQNASEFVFGLRAGLGFRYQFARKWDFYVEGSGQQSLNNWVKSDDIKTFQRTLSLQAGINLNL